MNKEEQEKKAEEIRKVQKVKNEYNLNLTEKILEEVRKRHMRNNDEETREDR